RRCSTATRVRAKTMCVRRSPRTSAAAGRTIASCARCCAPPTRWGGRDMNVSLSRRDFTKGLGGIVLAFTLDPVSAQQPKQLPGSLGGNRMLDAWIRINADGTATVFTGKVELGQGIVTALAQIAAEELDLPLARIAMVPGDTG